MNISSPTPTETSGRTWLLPVAVFAAGFAVSLLAWQWTAGFIDRKEREHLDFRVGETADAITARIDAQRNLLRAGAALFAASEEVSRRQWRTFVESLRLEEHFPGLQGLGFSMRLSPEDLPEHVRQIRAEGFTDYVVRPTGERPEYTAIIYLEPFDDRNQRAFGYDMFSEPVRRAAMEEARDEDRTTLSGKVTLMQETGRDVQAGFLMYTPVYRSGLPSGTATERRTALHGYVYSPFRATQFLRGIFPQGLQDLHLQVFDGRQTTPQDMLFASEDGRDNPLQTQGRLTTDRVIELYGHSWTLRLSAKPSFVRPMEHALPSAVFGAGSFLSLFFSLLVWTQGNTRKKARQLVLEVGERQKAEAEVRLFSESLEQRVRERTAALMESEKQFRTIIESSPVPYALNDDQHNITYLNPAFLETFGYDLQDIPTLADWWPKAYPDAAYREWVASTWQARLNKAEQTGLPFEPMELNIRCKDGTLRTALVGAVPLRETLNDLHLVILYDITERKQGEEKLREREELLSQSQRIASIGSWSWDLSTRILACTDETYRLFGVSPDTFVLSTESLVGLVHPDDRSAVREWFAAAEAGDRPGALEFRAVGPDGAIRTMRGQGEKISGHAIQPARVIGTVQDITELTVLEDQLRQSQKMEAIGRLAGGVAHDFNNQLFVINGYCDLLGETAAGQPGVLGPLEEIRKAARHSAELTRQLLAFSRKQVLQPKVLHLNAELLGIETMLRPLLGEHIQLSIVTGEDVGHVRADPVQLQQVITNLAVNARDAMPEGGRIRIKTSSMELEQPLTRAHVEVPPGRYVVLEVSDDGHGIDHATQARIFEPFFTTKAVGKGTGLGLASVHGIVKQSGGHIAVHSEPGLGTTFSVYLPRIDEVAQTLERTADKKTVGGVQTILLAEDEPALRAMLSRVLQGHGYRVLLAADGEQGLDVAQRFDGPIHLLLTDVVMPRMGGLKLAERLTAARPEMRIIYMSGYADDAIVRYGVSESGHTFLSKPCQTDVLLSKVREVLDATSRH